MNYHKSRKIYAQLGKKYNIKTDDMATLCMSPIKFFINVLTTEATKDPIYLPNVRIQGFGVFFAPEKRKLRLYNTNLKRSGKSNEEV